MLVYSCITTECLILSLGETMNLQNARRHDASAGLQGIVSNKALERIILKGVLGGIIANVMLRVTIWRGVFRGMEVNGV
jgi:uncharacterized membrane protein